MSEQKKTHPAFDALQRLMERLPPGHSEHAEPDRVCVAEFIEANERPREHVFADVGDRTDEALQAEIERLRGDVKDRDGSIVARDAAIAERDALIVELKTGRDNAFAAATTQAAKFSTRLELIRACLDSGVLETDAAKLQAIRTAVDAE